ncbi:hypothetical protein PV761_03950 [Arthrobacter sp. CC3]
MRLTAIVWLRETRIITVEADACETGQSPPRSHVRAGWQGLQILNTP